MTTQTKAHTRTYLRPAIVIRGLPGIGKTTLANEIIRVLKEEHGLRAFQVNADEVRGTINKGLGFSEQDRIENARRIGSLAFLASQNGLVPVVDFVMPTKLTFDAFADGIGATDFNLWSLRPNEEFRSRFEDTAKIFERLQEWWGGAVYESLHELAPFPEDQLNFVASRIVGVYLRSTLNPQL